MTARELPATVIALAALAEALLRIRWQRDLRGVVPARWPGLRLPPPDQLARGADRWLRLAQHPRPCLPRALALCLLLRRAGLPVVLHLGVLRRPGGTLHGHAWLSLAGAPYLERGAERLADFTETLRVPAAP